MNKNIWAQILIILVITVSSGLIYNLFSGQGIDILYSPLEINAGANLNAEQTYRLLREGQTLFIDARYQKEFAESHIPGAINIPANLSRDRLMSELESISKNRKIVVYCDSDKCQASRRLAGLMTYLGYERIYVYLPGFQEWQVKNYPVEK